MQPPRRPPAAPWRSPVAPRRPPGRSVFPPVAVAAALWLVASGQLRAEEFFATRNQNPLLRGFYLPLPSDTRLDSGAILSATLQVSNTINVEHTSRESLFVDGESDVLDLTFENALTRSWRYRLSVPIVHDSGGFLDSAV